MTIDATIGSITTGILLVALVVTGIVALVKFIKK
jgi:hypothetical protein